VDVQCIAFNLASMLTDRNRNAAMANQGMSRSTPSPIISGHDSSRLRLAHGRIWVLHIHSRDVVLARSRDRKACAAAGFTSLAAVGGAAYPRERVTTIVHQRL